MAVRTSGGGSTWASVTTGVSPGVTELFYNRPPPPRSHPPFCSFRNPSVFFVFLDPEPYILPYFRSRTIVCVSTLARSFVLRARPRLKSYPLVSWFSIPPRLAGIIRVQIFVRASSSDSDFPTSYLKYMDGMASCLNAYASSWQPGPVSNQSSRSRLSWAERTSEDRVRNGYR